MRRSRHFSNEIREAQLASWADFKKQWAIEGDIAWRKVRAGILCGWYPQDLGNGFQPATFKYFIRWDGWCYYMCSSTENRVSNMLLIRWLYPPSFRPLSYVSHHPGTLVVTSKWLVHCCLSQKKWNFWFWRIPTWKRLIVHKWIQ